MLRPFPMLNRVLAPAAVAIGLLPLFAGCSSKKEAPAHPTASLPTASIRVLPAQHKPHALTEEVVGTVRAKLQATLEAKVSGRLTFLPVAVGQRVKKGEIVARLDAGELNARLEQAEAALDLAERDGKRVASLFDQQAVTRAEFDAAQARIRLARGQAAEARAMMSYIEVAAPFDGVVTRKPAEVGDLASPGKPLLALEDPAVLQLEADLPQAIAAQVQAQARLNIRLDGTTNEITGTVSEIAPVADPLSRTLRVKVDLPAQPGLSSGHFARLLVPVGTATTLRVPNSAIVTRGQLEMVFVATNGQARLVLVRTGRSFGAEREVLSGLQANEAVVVDGAAALLDGQPVEVK